MQILRLNQRSLLVSELNYYLIYVTQTIIKNYLGTVFFKKTIISAAVVQSCQHIRLVQIIQLLHRFCQLVSEEPADQNGTDGNQPGFYMQLLHFLQFRIHNEIPEKILKMVHREDEVRFFILHHLIRKQLPLPQTLPADRFPVPGSAHNVKGLFLQGIAVSNEFLLVPPVNQA